MGSFPIFLQIESITNVPTEPTIAEPETESNAGSPPPKPLQLDAPAAPSARSSSCSGAFSALDDDGGESGDDIFYDAVCGEPTELAATQTKMAGTPAGTPRLQS